MIKVYKGSIKWFEEQLLNLEVVTSTDFLEYARDKEKPFGNLDQSVREKMFTGKDVLVFGQESYKRITTSGMSNIVFSVEKEVEKYDIDIYFHNPTKELEKQFKSLKPQPKVINQQKVFADLRSLKDAYGNFNNNILGQEQARDSIFSALYRTDKETEGSNVKVVLLYGPPGVGKTESVKWLSEKLDQPLKRIQMSMLQTDTAANYIFGSKHEEQSLALDLLSRNSNFILFDEFDKVPPAFYNSFYQMFDESMFEDMHYNVDLSDTTIFLTSNYMSESEIRRGIGAPLASRISTFVPFSKIQGNVFEHLVSVEIDSALAMLSREEKSLIPIEELKNIIIRNAQGLNPREIKKLIEGQIKKILVHKIFNEKTN